MSKPTEYLITRKVVAMVEGAKPSLQLLRLFHACYAYVDRDVRLSVHRISITNLPPCVARCSDLTAITGSPGGKSNAWVEEAVEHGRWRGLFSQLELDRSSTELTFKFAPQVGTASMRNLNDKIFAMLDSDEVRTISSAREILFYTKAVMVGQADQPSFTIPNVCPISSPWTDSSKKSWLRIVARVGARLGHDYVVVPQRDPLSRAIDQVRVKVVTSATRWSSGYLFPRPPVPPVAVVHAGEFDCLSKTELVKRRDWSKATGP